MTTPDDPLSLDIQNDLERVDAVMTRVIMDPVTTEEFIRDPSGVLTSLGLHPRTTREIHDRVNRIFWAVLTNTELMDVLLDHYDSFSPPLEAATVLDESTGRGEIRNAPELDMAAAEHALRDPDFLRRVYRLLLHDINNRRLLQNVYTTEELDDYVDRMVDALQERRAIRDIPSLEAWDDHYGVGTGYGVGEAEVGPVVTVIGGAEAGVVASVVIPVIALGVRRNDVLADRALRGDQDAVRALAVAGAALRFAGELLVHANNFERP
jgi:hypothetical protein